MVKMTLTKSAHLISDYFDLSNVHQLLLELQRSDIGYYYVISLRSLLSIERSFAYFAIFERFQ